MGVNSTLPNSADEAIARQLQQQEFQRGFNGGEIQMPVVVGEVTAQYPGTVVRGTPIDINEFNEATASTAAKYVSILRIVPSVKLVSAMDALFLLLSIISGNFIAFFLILLPILGYMGAKRLDARMLIGYIVYTIFILVVLGIGLFTYSVRTETLIWWEFALHFILDSIALVLTMRLRRLITTSTPDELQVLRIRCMTNSIF